MRAEHRQSGSPYRLDDGRGMVLVVISWGFSRLTSLLRWLRDLAVSWITGTPAPNAGLQESEPSHEELQQQARRVIDEELNH